MATNDNRAMVEAAREFITKHRSRYPPLMDNSQQYRAMADFAALAVAAERTRMADELEAILSAKLDRGDWLANIWTYIDKLRAECDADR